MLSFPVVAGLTERLGIGPGACAASADWDDVIKRKVLRRSAAGTLAVKPINSLFCREVVQASAWASNADQFGLLRNKPPKAATVGRDTFSLAARNGDIASDHAGFAVNDVAAKSAGDRLATKAHWTQSATISASHAGFEISLPARFGAEPTRLLFRLNPELLLAKVASQKVTDFGTADDQPLFSGLPDAGGGTEADLLATSFSVANIGGEPSEASAAHLTREHYLWHGIASSEKPGELREPQGHIGSFHTIPANPEPSRACKNHEGSRGAEGATTRGCGNNNPPTSARHRSNGEDIVSAARITWNKAQKPIINRSAEKHPIAAMKC